ncbi:MAG: glycosyltransferase family 4 protein [Actinomycetota bacterium]|nr:glycosyltransferase family 4 protein [Actinomycetota bacterium]
MKVGIVVPYSWSFWGGVPEHAFQQARALEALGIETRTLIGNDPPGRLTRLLHPRTGRHGEPPPDVLPIGRSVIVPANGALPNIVISPPAVTRVRRILAEEDFDVLHLHEPMTPAICTAALAFARCPVVATFHAAGDLGWLKLAKPVWGFLVDRIDRRIAVSEYARASTARYFPGEYEVLPNGVLIPTHADSGARENNVVFIGRHEPRKGLPVLLRAWPAVHRATGARLRIVGADRLMVRLVLSRTGVGDDGIDSLGYVSTEERTRELQAAKVFVAPSLGGESFGMILAESFACATPVVASDIAGYRDVMTVDTGSLVPPGDSEALAQGLIDLLGDEPRRRAAGEAARRLAKERYSWDDVAGRLAEIYQGLSSAQPAGLAAAS